MPIDVTVFPENADITLAKDGKGPILKNHPIDMELEYNNTS